MYQSILTELHLKKNDDVNINVKGTHNILFLCLLTIDKQKPLGVTVFTLLKILIYRNRGFIRLLTFIIIC